MTILTCEGEVEMNDAIEITYCTEWNYLPLASSLAAAIKDKFGLNTTLQKGHGGILKITMGDTVVYDNSSKCGQLPTADDVIKAMEKIR